MYIHQRENWFPRLHAAACLAGTYTAFGMLPFVDPNSVSGIPAQALVPAALLVPFFASLVSFILFAPASFLLFRLIERFNCRNWAWHCLAGPLCVSLTLLAILLGGYVASAFENAGASGGLDSSSWLHERLFFIMCAVSGAAGGTTFYLARKMTIPQAYTSGRPEW